MFILGPLLYQDNCGPGVIIDSCMLIIKIQSYFHYMYSSLFSTDFLPYRFGGQDHYSIIGQGSLRIADLGEIDTGVYRVRASSSTDGSTLEKTVRVTAQGE